MADKKVISGAEFMKEELKRGISGAYFFYGEEDYMKEYYLHEIEAKTVGDRSSMNFIRLTSDEFSLGALEEAMTSAPIADMFSVLEESAKDSVKLIELYEVDFKPLKPTEFTAVSKLIRDGASSETVVVIFSTEAELPHESKSHAGIIRELSKAATPVEFKAESDARLAAWLSKLAAKESVILEPFTARLLIERVGHSMFVLKNEVQKLTSFVKAYGRNKISGEDISEVSVTNKEISPFDFTNALMRRDAKSAFYILSDMKSRGEDPIMILATVSRVLGELIKVRGSLDSGLTRAEVAASSGMHEYRVKLYSEALANTDITSLFEIARAVSDADISLKSTPVEKFVIIERLIAILCNRSRG